MHKEEISYLFAYLKAFIVQTRGKKYLLEEADPHRWEGTAHAGTEGCMAPCACKRQAGGG